MPDGIPGTATDRSTKGQTGEPGTSEKGLLCAEVWLFILSTQNQSLVRSSRPL